MCGYSNTKFLHTRASAVGLSLSVANVLETHRRETCADTDDEIQQQGDSSADGLPMLLVYCNGELVFNWNGWTRRQVYVLHKPLSFLLYLSYLYHSILDIMFSKSRLTLTTLTRFEQRRAYR